MRIATAFLAILAITGFAHAQDHLRFVVTGDDRWNTKAPRPGEDENGVNVGAMKRLSAAIVGEKPQVLLFNGDLVGGGETDEEERSQFDTWLKAMSPIYDAGIRVLAARGNHEMHCPHAADVWKDVFTGKYALPQNGPAGEEGMTYSYTQGKVMFLSLDQFQTNDLKINQGWLDQTLAKPHPAHVFAFAHKMAFFSGNHVDGMFKAPEARDAMLKSLASAGSRAVFFGHDHLYDHCIAKFSGWTDDQFIHQFVVGTAGAPFVKTKELPTADGNWSLTRGGHDGNRLGYCVVDVDGPNVTIVYKAETAPGVFTAIETTTYKVPATTN